MKSFARPFPSRSVLLVMLFGSLSFYCVAQQPPAPSAPPPPPQPVPAPQGMAPRPVAPEIKEGMVTLKFNNAALDQVLQFYSELSGKTIMLSPNIAGNITLRTNGEISREEAQSLIEGQLIRNNVALVEDGKVLVAVQVGQVSYEIQTIVYYDSKPPSEIARGVMMRCFSLKFLTPAQAQQLLQPLLPPWGRLQPIERLNSILVTDTAPNLRKIKAFLTEMDQPLESPNRMHIIQLRHRRPSDLKAEIESLFSMPTASATGSYGSPAPIPAGAPGVIRAMPRPVASTVVNTPSDMNAEPPVLHGSLSIMADDGTGLLVFICRPENMKMIDQLIAALDVKIEPEANGAASLSNIAKEQATKSPEPPAAK